MIFCGVVGVLIERIAYKPLRHATRITALITAIGVSYVLEYATQYIMGSEVRTYPKLLTSASFHLGLSQLRCNKSIFLSLLLF